ncbi:MAG: hypothetical protein ACRCX8_12675 [Sarcina sp.]
MKRIARHKYRVSNTIKKVEMTLVENRPTHVARIYGIQQLPNGEFTEVELGTNKVLIGGLRELSYLLYNMRPRFTKPTFEEVLYATADEDLRASIVANTLGRVEPWVQGFNVSYDGAQGDGVIDPIRHKDGWDFSHLIPFRVIPLEMNDFATYKQYYLHHRIVTINSKQYVEYYTKKTDFTVRAVFKDGSSVPDDPNVNATTDLDSRLISEFPVNITEEELVEHWRLRKEEGAEGAHFNSTMLMIGKPAKITLAGAEFATMIETHTYSKSNHVSVAHGVDAFISVKYQLLHI